MAISVAATPERRNNVYFEQNSTQLTAAARLLLDTVYNKLPETNSMRIIPVGEIGDDIGLYKASEIYYQRAQAVYDYYVAKGIDIENLEIAIVKANGQSLRGVVSTVYRAGDIEVKVTKLAKEKQVELSSLIDYFPQSVQKFRIDPIEGGKIVGAQGTVINFPINAFDCPTDVDVELMEFYSYADLLKADLHTMSDGYMLETGGTININAKCNGTAADLTEGSQIGMEFPVKGWYREGMQTFIGEQSGEDMNWVASEDDIEQEYYGEDDYWEGGIDTFYTENPEPPYNLIMTVSRTRRVSGAVLDKYVLSSGELGWINCDRFYDAPEVTNFVVSLDEAEKSSVWMIFKDIKSVMSGYQGEKGKINFNGIPTGQVVTLVACSIKDKKPYLAVKEIRITKDGYDELRLVETTKAGLESQLMALK